MKSWNLSEPRKLELVNTEDPAELVGKIKVKVTRSVITASDMALYEGRAGKYPSALGRIGVGQVSECFDPALKDRFKKGRRVILCPYLHAQSSCPSDPTAVGYLSDYVVCDSAYLHPLPEVRDENGNMLLEESVSDEAAVCLEDVAIAIKAYEKLDVNRAQYVVINGCSTVNLVFAQLCIYYQAIPVVIDNDPQRLQIAGDLGIYYQVNTQEENPEQKIKEITSGKMADFMIVDTDAFPAVGDMLNYVGNNGKVALVGINPKPAALRGDVSPILTRNLTVFGMNNGCGEFETALNMLVTEVVTVDTLIGKRLDFEEVADKIVELSGQTLAFKIVVKC